jgi:hypothetical protein
MRELPSTAERGRSATPKKLPIIWFATGLSVVLDLMPCDRRLAVLKPDERDTPINERRGFEAVGKLREAGNSNVPVQEHYQAEMVIPYFLYPIGNIMLK